MKKQDLGLIGIVLLIDQLTKWWIANNITLYESITIIKDFFYLTYTQNTGAAFSIFEGQMVFFYLVTAVALGFLFYYFHQTQPKNWLQRLMFIFLIAGTMGNFIDRIVLQYVRDFFHFRFFGWDFAIFNVADAALNIGVGLMILDVVLEERKRVR